ncbi:hypothetical protein AB6N23_12355 [Cellulomonas sp. 179-A 9B4 NHS]|uniref:hypothetical protein n=1 Tax=Cellulomonas sp. 179-A 9B4 NHS TaxID=3142379 RepID=UPI0039A1468B
MTRRERTWTVVAALLGAGTAVAGVLRMRTGTVSFGWFAYTPLSETVYAPSPAPWRLGAALVVLGVLLVGAAGGFALGRRRRADGTTGSAAD